MSRCKKCGAEIHWIRMKGTGKMMPCDTEVKLFGHGSGKTTYVTSDGEVRTGQEDPHGIIPGYIPHWATCPYADNFRKK